MGRRPLPAADNHRSASAQSGRHFRSRGDLLLASQTLGFTNRPTLDVLVSHSGSQGHTQRPITGARRWVPDHGLNPPAPAPESIVGIFR